MSKFIERVHNKRRSRPPTHISDDCQHINILTYMLSYFSIQLDKSKINRIYIMYSTPSYLHIKGASMFLKTTRVKLKYTYTLFICLSQVLLGRMIMRFSSSSICDENSTTTLYSLQFLSCMGKINGCWFLINLGATFSRATNIIFTTTRIYVYGLFC